MAKITGTILDGAVCCQLALYTDSWPTCPPAKEPVPDFNRDLAPKLSDLVSDFVSDFVDLPPGAN